MGARWIGRGWAIVAVAATLSTASCGIGDEPSTISVDSTSGPPVTTELESTSTTVAPNGVAPNTVTPTATSVVAPGSLASRLAGPDGSVFVVDLDTVRLLTADEPFVAPAPLDASVLTGVVAVRGTGGRWETQFPITGSIGYPVQAVLVGQHVVIAAVTDPTSWVDLTLWTVDTASGVWSQPTGLDTDKYRHGLALTAVGDHVLVHNGGVTQVLSPDTGTIGPVVEHPEAAALVGTTAGIGVITPHASIAIAVDNNSGDGPYLSHPWLFDVNKGTWRAVAWPSWLPRGRWPLQAPHEPGWFDFAAYVDGQVVACSTAKNGFCGTWDPMTDKWRRLDSAPTSLPGATPIVTGSKLEVVATTPCCIDLDASMSPTTITSAVLDVRTGHWSSGTLRVDITNGTSHVVTTADAEHAFLSTDDAPEPGLAKVLDLGPAHPTCRDASSSDLAAFHIATGRATLSELGLS